MCLELRYAKSGKAESAGTLPTLFLSGLASNWLGAIFKRGSVSACFDFGRGLSSRVRTPPRRITKAELFTICALATVRNLHPGVHLKFLDYCHSSCPLAFKSPYLRTHRSDAFYGFRDFTNVASDATFHSDPPVSPLALSIIVFSPLLSDFSVTYVFWVQLLLPQVLFSPSLLRVSFSLQIICSSLLPPELLLQCGHVWHGTEGNWTLLHQR